MANEIFKINIQPYSRNGNIILEVDDFVFAEIKKALTRLYAGRDANARNSEKKRGNNDGFATRVKTPRILFSDTKPWGLTQHDEFIKTENSLMQKSTKDVNFKIDLTQKLPLLPPSTICIPQPNFPMYISQTPPFPQKLPLQINNHQ
jgi:hypothetical protein